MPERLRKDSGRKVSVISILAHSARQTLRYSTIFAIVASCMNDVPS